MPVTRLFAVKFKLKAKNCFTRISFFFQAFSRAKLGMTEKEIEREREREKERKKPVCIMCGRERGRCRGRQE